MRTESHIFRAGRKSSIPAWIAAIGLGLAGFAWAGPPRYATPLPRRTPWAPPARQTPPSGYPRQTPARTPFAAAPRTPSPTASAADAQGLDEALGSTKPRATPRSKRDIPSNYRPLDPRWIQLPADMAGPEKGAAARLPNVYSPRLLPSQRIRLQRLAAMGSSLSLLYIAVYGFLLRPLFPFGVHRLTFFERTYRLPNILVGESAPLTLRRARRAWDSRRPLEWHPLAGLPPGARLSFPLRGKTVGEGRVIERYEFSEPENMRQWRLYVLEVEGLAQKPCLLVYPANLGDWKSVRAEAGRVHSTFATDDAPFAWPPTNDLDILGSHGWPTRFHVRASSWPKAGIEPMRTELQGTIRRLGDPPGREYPPRAAAFWSYEAVKEQQQPPAERFLHLFLIVNDAILIETNETPVGEIAFDLGRGEGALSLLTPEG